ncbi:MAG: hypothetical protein JSW39_26915 [Desulfobacterales bacterium]|nr:MAG: hypothetical protein JSW39_26915 [Desulfobacterales bacterium]
MSTISKMNPIYERIPALYRERDAAQGYPLRALLQLIQDQAEILHTDIRQLWDDFFIETCQPWVIPYIGDLVSNNLLYDASRIKPSATATELFRDLTGPDLLPDMAVRIRADVAKTIYYRRRKGTLPMLEELARDVTGWPAHAVEFFRLLGWTQNLNHLRFEAEDGIDLRDVEKVERLNGAFDVGSHTVDVRDPAQSEGWHNIPNIGFFLWRLQSYPLIGVPARPAGQPWQYHFSPLGNPAPLFNAWRREGDASGLAGERHVPGPLRPAFFFDDLECYRRQGPPRLDVTDLYGPIDQGGSFYIERNGSGVDPAIDPTAPPHVFQPQIVCRRLNPWPAAQPTGQLIAVDVEHGRIAVGDGFGDATTSLDVFYHYGFSADLGGGPYERGKWVIAPSLEPRRLYVQQDSPPLGVFPSIGAALTEWTNQLKPNTVITILDNRTYAELLDIEPGDDAWLAIEAANGVRPHIRPDGGRIRISGTHPDATVTLNGLLVEGGVEVEGDCGTLPLIHTTLVPGRALDEAGQPVTTDPSVRVTDTSGGVDINTHFELQAAFSILGPVRMPEHSQKLYLLDCIVDGIGTTAIAATGTTDQPVPVAILERTTIFGQSFFRSIDLATEVIFAGTVTAEERHQGCVRFSFVPHGSRTPRRYRCQPDFEIATALRKAKDRAKAEGITLLPSDLDDIRAEIRACLVPTFTARDYGLPGYAQLRMTSPVQIRTGAEDGSEMGVFSHLQQPQREANLRIRLDEYLPFGLRPGIIFVT